VSGCRIGGPPTILGYSVREGRPNSKSYKTSWTLLRSGDSQKVLPGIRAHKKERYYINSAWGLRAKGSVGGGNRRHDRPVLGNRGENERKERTMPFAAQWRQGGR